MNDLEPVFSVLLKADSAALNKISSNLADAWAKAQIYRTDTEARLSVLNDGKHPTRASKYWQAVREQTVMLDNLTEMSFNMRRNNLELKKAEKRIEESKNDIEAESARIDYDECLWKKASGEKVAHDRVREILMWEKIKTELNDGSFDSMDVNTHQAESMHKHLSFRRNCLTPASSPDEVRNVLGPLQTLERVKAENLKCKPSVNSGKPQARINGAEGL